MAPNNLLEEFVQRARQLYSVPAVAMKVLQLTRNPTIDVQALKECIENDPALTAKLLRVVNSSVGTAELRGSMILSAVPPGLLAHTDDHPAFKRWASVNRPSGTIK